MGLNTALILTAQRAVDLTQVTSPSQKPNLHHKGWLGKTLNATWFATYTRVADEAQAPPLIPMFEGITQQPMQDSRSRAATLTWRCTSTLQAIILRNLPHARLMVNSQYALWRL